MLGGLSVTSAYFNVCYYFVFKCLLLGCFGNTSPRDDLREYHLAFKLHFSGPDDIASSACFPPWLAGGSCLAQPDVGAFLGCCERVEAVLSTQTFAR